MFGLKMVWLCAEMLQGISFRTLEANSKNTKILSSMNFHSNRDVSCPYWARSSPQTVAVRRFQFFSQVFNSYL